jgi:hypothetical protein
VDRVVVESYAYEILSEGTPCVSNHQVLKISTHPSEFLPEQTPCVSTHQISSHPSEILPEGTPCVSTYQILSHPSEILPEETPSESSANIEIYSKSQQKKPNMAETWGEMFIAWPKITLCILINEVKFLFNLIFI